MKNIDTAHPVLVTGATGYVAGWLIKRLLEAGVTVHAAVRDPSSTDKLMYLNEVAASAPGEIHYFESDLLKEGSYAEAMQGCSTVFHTASPFSVEVKDPQTQLVDPALLGTRNVLKEANRTPSVKRVVLTSSCVAIYGDNVDMQNTKGGIFTEEDWNTTSSLHHNPYFFSKTEAEKAAWEVAREQDQWDLVVVNPSLVMGPGLNPHATSESFSLIRQLGDGSFKAGVPDWGMGVVDVRDLADAHVAAAFTPEANGRNIISGHNTSFPGMAEALVPTFGNDYPIPKKILPKWLTWLVGPLTTPGMTHKTVSRNVGYPWKADNSKSRSELGMTYRPLEETMVEFFQQMIDSGQFKKS